MSAIQTLEAINPFALPSLLIADQQQLSGCPGTLCRVSKWQELNIAQQLYCSAVLRKA